MKIKMLSALGLCLAFTFQISAQGTILFSQESRLMDSIYITPFAGCKIVLVGKRINNLLKENNLEILKNKFIEDYRESAKDKDFPMLAKTIIYLASQDGRRRLKAMPDEDVPLDIENEIKAFIRDLPPFHYTIYDLAKAFEYHLYVSSPDNLEQLYKINYSSVFAGTIADNPAKIKHYTSIALTPTTTGYNISRLRTKKVDFLSLGLVTGVGLINSTLSPMIGFDADFVAANKYGKHNLKAGLSFSFNVLADYQNRAFSNFNGVYSTELHFLKNLSNTKENFWFGFSAGRYYTDKIFGSAHNGTLDKAWKFGIVNQFKDFGVEYNFIYDRSKNRNAAITLKYYF